MPRGPRLSQRELDEEFEQFLKESLSDDSMDFTSKRKKSPRRAKKDDSSTPWWMKDDDDIGLKSGRSKKNTEDEPSSTPSSMKWLKPKKQSTPLREVQEEPDEEILKPKNTLQKGKRIEEEEEPEKTPATTRRQISRDSLEEDNFDEKFEESHKRSGVIPEQASFEDTYSQSEPTDGLTTGESTGRDPYEAQGTLESTGQDPYGGQSTLGSTGPGAETLEEMADKAKFFKELEEKAGRTLDYSRLNREADLSGTMGTMGTLPSAYMGSPEDTGPQVKKMEDLFPADPGKADTPAKKTSPSEEDQKDGGMLGKVALLDTIDSTLSPVKPPSAPRRSPPAGGHGDAPSTKQAGFLQSGPTGPTDTRGLSTGGTTGELEALQAILREAAATPTLHLGDDMDQSVNKGTRERTVEDILREAKEERRSRNDAHDENRGFNLEPARIPSNEDPEQRGFDLQPANQEPRIGSHDSDVRRTDSEARGFALSPVSEAQEGFRGFDLQPASPILRGMDLQPASGADIESVDGSHPLPTQARRPTSRKKSPSKPRGRYAHVRSSGYGPQQGGKKAAWSPADVGKQKVKGSEIPALNGREDKTQRHLLASVESFASYLHDQFTDGRRTTPPLKQSTEEPILSASMREAKLHTLSRERALVAEVNEWQQQWQEERRLNAKMKAEIADLQRVYERKETDLRLGHEKEMFKLKQENFVLVAKLNSQDDQDKARRRELVSGKTPEGVSQDEQLKLMQREIVQQETLLQGYQQENERLFGEVKKLQVGNKENEARMFKENQRLQTEVGNLRELMEMKDRALRNKGIITGDKLQQEIAAGNTAVLGAGKIAELQAEIKEHEVSEASLRAEIRRLSQEKKELEDHIEQLVREKSRQQERLNTMRDGKHNEFKELQMKYEREMESLQKKVRWYTENQELLDKDAAALREKDEEIAELKEQLKNGPKPNSKNVEAQRRAKERAADAKKIQDLERQVREMNDIIRRRHPNSLPALIYAAASTSSPLPADVKGQRSAEGQPRSITFLEDKVKRLENELEGKEEESKRGLRVVEQKYNAMKVRYEDRIKSLESQLEQYETGRLSQSRPHTSVTALQKELDGIRERNRHQLEEMEKENRELKRKLAKAVSSAMSGGDGSGKDGQIGRGLSEKELQGKLTHLALELGAKDKELELLKATVDRLMEERFHAMNAAESNKGKSKKLKRQGSKAELVDEKGVDAKPYIPENFTGSHISDVLMENERLKHQLDDMSLEMGQQRVRLHASLAKAESASRKAREGAAEEMALMRSHHQMEVERMKAERAMMMGDSKMMRLNTQLESQQVMVRELQDQLNEARLEIDRLQASRVRERVMETQVEQLRLDLREAKENHSPEMKHFEALQAKIAALESRHIQRDKDLQLLVERATHSATAEKDQEILTLRGLLASKNMEIQRFRVELEAILEVLRELQRQGVVLPLDSHTVHNML